MSDTDTPADHPLTHPEETVIRSDVFRYINRQIDEKVGHIQMLMDVMAQVFEDAKAPKPHIPIGIAVRLEAEDRVNNAKAYGDVETVDLAFTVHGLKRIRDAINRIEVLESDVQVLMNHKRRLLVRGDCTNDPSDQLAVFGPAEGVGR